MAIYEKLVVDPLVGSNRRFSSGFSSDYYPDSVYVLSGLDTDFPDSSIKVAEFDNEGNLVQSDDMDYTGAGDSASAIGPLIRPPDSDKLYTAHALNGSSETDSSTWFVELNASDLSYVQHSNTPNGTGKSFSTRDLLNLASNEDGTAVVGFFSGNATTPLNSYGVWIPGTNTVNYFACDTDLGYTTATPPSSCVFDEDGYLWIFVGNRPASFQNNVSLAKYTVTPSAGLTHVETIVIDTDAANSWICLGMIYHQPSNEIILGVSKIGVPNIVYTLVRFSVAGETIEDEYEFTNDNFYGGQLFGNAIRMSLWPMGASGSWMTTSIIGGGVPGDSPYQTYLGGFRTMDFLDGTTVDYDIDLWGSDEALPELLSGNILYVTVSPTKASFWSFRYNDDDWPIEYEGFGIWSILEEGPPPVGGRRKASVRIM